MLDFNKIHDDYFNSVSWFFYDEKIHQGFYNIFNYFCYPYVSMDDGFIKIFVFLLYTSVLIFCLMIPVYGCHNPSRTEYFAYIFDEEYADKSKYYWLFWRIFWVLSRVCLLCLWLIMWMIIYYLCCIMCYLITMYVYFWMFLIFMIIQNPTMILYIFYVPFWIIYILYNKIIFKLIIIIAQIMKWFYSVICIFVNKVIIPLICYVMGKLIILFKLYIVYYILKFFLSIISILKNICDIIISIDIFILDTIKLIMYWVYLIIYHIIFIAPYYIPAKIKYVLSLLVIKEWLMWVCLFIPTMLIIILLYFYITEYKKYNEEKLVDGDSKKSTTKEEKRSILMMIKIIIISLSLLISLLLLNTRIHEFFIIGFDWNCVHLLFVEGVNLYYYFYLWTILLYIIIFSIIYNLVLQDTNISMNAEKLIIILMSLQGNILLLSCTNLMLIFLGFEILGISVYILIGLCGLNNLKDSEAAIKFFLFGSLISGIFLYGLSLLFAEMGSLDYKDIITISANNNYGIINYSDLNNLLFLMVVIIIIISLLFKLGVVPLHSWVLNVYEGTSLINVFIISVISKLSIIYILLNILFVVFKLYTWDITLILKVISVLTIIIGVSGAFFSSTIKKLWAYSSIGHMGFVLLGISTGVGGGIVSGLFYICVYILLTISFFLLIFSTKVVNNNDNNIVEIRNINELSLIYEANKYIGWFLVIIIISFSGLPPFGMFLSKYYLLDILINMEYYFEAYIVILSSVVSCITYTRIGRIIVFDKSVIENGYDNIIIKDISYSHYLIFSIFFIFSVFIFVYHGYLLLILNLCIENLIW